MGFKGSDGLAQIALRGNVRLVSPHRAERFLKTLNLRLAHSEREQLLFLTASGVMGEQLLAKHGFSYKALHHPPWPTSRQDTVKTAEQCLREGAEIAVFVGGDGTARDIAAVLGDTTPLLGVPAGVKMYSGVFAETPEAAAEALIDWLRGEATPCPAEILDIDEEAYRRNELRLKLYSSATTLCTQGVVTVTKQPLPTRDTSVAENITAIARYIAENMQECTLYVLGPGSTVAAIADVIGVKKTLLGVDVVHDGRVVARDVDEETLYELVRSHRERGGEVKIILTPIGGQGFILGRGNQQISPRVLRSAGGKSALIVAVPHAKLRTTPVLRVDTGDPHLDRELAGYIRVVTDYGEETLAKITRYPERRHGSHDDTA